SEGKEKEGVPAIGNYFRINIPGPGSPAGDGYDWVRVEKIEDEIAPDAEQESFTIQVRPAPNPKKREETAHFFDSGATSSFVVNRKDRTVSAAVFGRNEKPNTKSRSLPDKIRNAVVGKSAQAGFSDIQ